MGYDTLGQHVSDILQDIFDIFGYSIVSGPSEMFWNARRGQRRTIGSGGSSLRHCPPSHTPSETLTIDAEMAQMVQKIRVSLG
jgi:hypothetical protein